MKKLKYFMAALLVSMVALTGCSKKNSLSPSEAIKKAVNNIQGSKSYKMNMVMSVGMSMGESMSFDMSLNGDIISDIENGISYTKMATNILGQDVTTETYTDIKSQDGKMITYTKVSDDDSWSKEITDYSDTFNYASFFESLEKNNNIKELSSDKNNYNYEITIPASDFKEIASLMGNDSLDTFADINGNLKMKISIDKETGNYSKLYVDMKDLMVEAMKSSGAEGVNISKAEFTITISDYNTAGEVKIPEEALNADENNIEFDGNLINSFVNDDYDKILTCNASEDGYTSEITFGFIDDKYAKAYEETSQIFDTKEEADEVYNQITEEADDNQFVYVFDKEVSVTIYYEPEEDEEDYSYSDVKSLMETKGYVCE